MYKIISRSQIEKYIRELQNPIDRFIILGLFFGLNGNNDYKEQYLTIKKSQVDLEQSKITLSDGRVVFMDPLFRQVTKEAMAQTTYYKIGGTGAGHSDEEYELNGDNEYIIKARPIKSNNYGTMPMTLNGFKTRMRALSIYLTGSSGLSPTLIRSSGAYDLIHRQNKKLTFREAERILKENGLNIRRNTLCDFLKYLNAFYI